MTWSAPRSSQRLPDGNPSDARGLVQIATVQGARDVARDGLPAKVGVLRHGHVRVTELVRDLPCGEPGLVEFGGGRLAEHMARDPRELLGAARFAEIARPGLLRPDR